MTDIHDIANIRFFTVHDIENIRLFTVGNLVTLKQGEAARTIADAMNTKLNAVSNWIEDCIKTGTITEEYGEIQVEAVLQVSMLVSRKYLDERIKQKNAELSKEANL